MAKDIKIISNDKNWQDVMLKGPDVVKLMKSIATPIAQEASTLYDGVTFEVIERELKARTNVEIVSYDKTVGYREMNSGRLARLAKRSGFGLSAKAKQNGAR